MRLVSSFAPEAWPGPPSSPELRIVATDYDTGARVPFGRAGAPPASPAEAAAASCAVPGWFAPVRIAGRRYVDGGVCSATSADLLLGPDMPPVDEALVLVPLARRGRVHLSGAGAAADGLFRGIVGGRSAREIARLRSAGRARHRARARTGGPRRDGLERHGRPQAGRGPAHGAAHHRGVVGAEGPGRPGERSDGAGRDDRVRSGYVPTTVAGLRKLLAEEQVQPLSGTAFALTPGLREAYTAGDDEELEYVAMTEAARASLRLLATELAEDPDAPARRAVIAADVDDVTLRPDLDAAVVRVAGPIPRRRLASVHLDLAEAADAVRAAAAVIDAADLGDEDAELALGDAEDHELAWYGAPGAAVRAGPGGPHRELITAARARARNASPARSPSAIRPSRNAGERSAADAESSARSSSMRSMPTSR